MHLATYEELESCSWQEALETISGDNYYSYSYTFRMKAKDFTEGSSHYRSLMILSAICSCYFSNDDTAEPFQPAFVLENAASFIPQDLPLELEEPLFSFAKAIDEPNIKARIFDILWIRKSKYRLESANLAIDNYLAATKINKTTSDVSAYFRRCVNIAFELGKGGIELREKVVDAICQYLASLPVEQISGLQINLLRLLATKSIGDCDLLITVSRQAYENFEANNNFHLYRECLKLYGQFLYNSGQKNSNIIKELSCNIAESFVTESKTKNNSIAQAHFLKLAIYAYREIPGCKAKADELHLKLLEIQSKIPDELLRIKTSSIDVSSIIQQVEEKVSDKTLFEAFMALAFIVAIPNADEEYNHAKSDLKKYFFTHFFSQSYSNSQGKTVAQIPSTDPSNPTENEDVVFAKVIRNIVLHSSYIAHTCIAPAIRTINLEHMITEEMLLELVTNHLFVPPGHEMYFAKGIKAGFDFDFVSANLLLIPQLENSIRYIMAMNGKIISTIDSSGIQKERDLKSLLSSADIGEIFDQDMVLTLKALMTEQLGANLRNMIAHGLVQYNTLQSMEAIYCWWLILRLLMTPYLHVDKPNNVETAK